MITRATLGLAALLASASLGTPALAADWDGSAQAAHRHAGLHHRHHLHHHQQAFAARAHRRVLYRNPAYGARWAQPRPVAAHGWRGDQRWHASYRGPYATPRYAYPVRPIRYTYAHPVAGSYVGGGLIGALYNQPACYCR
jgi:hypothetical protein